MRESEQNRVFESCGCYPTAARVRTNGVVESLDVGKHGVGSLVVGEELSKVKALALETAKEVFGDSAIIRIAFAAHALNKACIQEGGAK